MGLDKEDIMALITILQKGLDDNESEEQVEPKRKRTARTKQKTDNKKNKMVNKFLTMSERNMHKEDTLIDKKLNVLPPTERTRQFKPVTVKCRVCGKEEQINPNYLESKERYKCNKCSTSAG
jgi:hypothetical protein